MSLLTPLYALGLLAVSLPVIFHLIRRMPRGETPFSSLIFLSPSPPRLSRRSRLEHWLLLLLRAAVIVLVAFAFARPFLRQANMTQIGPGGKRRVVFLVDTSASMRRTGLWDRVRARIDRRLAQLDPHDELALMTFDHRVHARLPLGRAASGQLDSAAAEVRDALAAVTPGWGPSHLDQALIAAAEELHATGEDTKSQNLLRQIVLVSDLQEGCRLDRLPTYHWPPDVQLVIEAVTPPGETNAGVSLAPAADDLEDAPDDVVRVLVENDRQSVGQQFELRWIDQQGKPLGDAPAAVHVPPGESRVVRLPRPQGGPADQIALSGDDHPFDNVLYLVPAEKEVVSVLYLGPDAPDDPNGLGYYLQPAFPETPYRKVQVVHRKPSDPIPDQQLQSARLVVVGSPLADRPASQLKSRLEDGGTILIVLKDPAMAALLRGLVGRPGIRVTDAETADYALLGTISFNHPLFAPFADPHFSDFTKIHFWNHRRIEDAAGQDADVLARFDNGDPALIQWTKERGSVLALTSGWDPADSQLARSTKFVPLLWRLLETAGGAPEGPRQFRIGDPVPFPAGRETTEDVLVRHPDGTEDSLASLSERFERTDQPGIYQWSAGRRRGTFAVNLARAESRTARLDTGVLEQRGVPLAGTVRPEDRAARQRQMRDIELEGRQKIWRWLLAAALAFLLAETCLAGHLARRATKSPPADPNPAET